MNPQQQQDLFKRYLEGTATSEERTQVEQWYFSFDELTDTLEQEHIPSAIGEKIYKGIQSQTKEGKQIQLWSVLGRIAAALLVGLLGSGLFYQYWETHIQDTAYTYVRAPKGELRKVYLPDSTLVSLNKGTILKYVKSQFGTTKREVWLEAGEAYFEVKRNEHQPFIVYTGPVETKVLGTAFNIKKSSQFKDIEVSVAHGKVQVSSLKAILGYLTQGKQINYNTLSGESYSSEFNPAYTAAWNKTNIDLNRASFKELSAVLYSLYNIKLKAGRQEIQNYKYTLTLNKSLSGDMALEIIRAIHQLNQRIENEQVVLY